MTSRAEKPEWKQIAGRIGKTRFVGGMGHFTRQSAVEPLWASRAGARRNIHRSKAV
ncbi:MAG TPA: hypothetical protein VLS27_13730 [Gammaproteobacteria bacterium]|nr:hypothetical protein [Gammaproteobacteria bacterium]